MVEVLWTLFLIGVGVLWVALIFLGWNSSGVRYADERWPVWKVLLRGGHEQREEREDPKSPELPARGEPSGYEARMKGR
ncbi:MAG: hypothetical protein WA982_09940 [Rubrobacteraceae bacterium]